MASPPVITSSGTAERNSRDGFLLSDHSYQLAHEFRRDGVAGGLTVNTASGLISGTPTGAGTSSVTVSATNSAGTGSAPLTLTISGGTGVSGFPHDSDFQ